MSIPREEQLLDLLAGAISELDVLVAEITVHGSNMDVSELSARVARLRGHATNLVIRAEESAPRLARASQRVH